MTIRSVRLSQAPAKFTVTLRQEGSRNNIVALAKRGGKMVSSFRVLSEQPPLPSSPGSINNGGDLHFTFGQTAASDEWLIYHGLGKFPSVAIVDSAGDEVEGDVSYVDANTVRVRFSAAFTGKAYLN